MPRRRSHQPDKGMISKKGVFQSWEESGWVPSVTSANNGRWSLQGRQRPVKAVKITMRRNVI